MVVNIIIPVLLALLIAFSMNATNQCRAGALEEEFISEFGILYPEGQQNTAPTLAKIKALLDKKVDVNTTNARGDTLLISAAVNGDLEMVKLLVMRGANVNLKSENDEVTPLMAAAFNDDLNILDILLKSKADVKAMNKDGETVLLIAVGGNTAISKWPKRSVIKGLTSITKTPNTG